MNSPSATKPDSLTPALLAWLLPQLLCLLLSAARVPLSAHPPIPIESVALAQLAVVQIVLAAMLAPILFRSLSLFVAIVLTAGPLLLSAGFLSAAEPWKINALWVSGGSWALALSAGGGLLFKKSPAGRMGGRPLGVRWSFVSAIATTWSLGGLLIAYLHAEFSPAPSIPDWCFGPAYVAIQISRAAKIPASFWWFVGAIPTLGLASGYAARFIHRSNPSKSGPVEVNGNPPESAEQRAE